MISYERVNVIIKLSEGDGSRFMTSQKGESLVGCIYCALKNAQFGPSDLAGLVILLSEDVDECSVKHQAEWDAFVAAANAFIDKTNQD